MATPLGRSSGGYAGSYASSSSGYPGPTARAKLSDFVPPGMLSQAPQAFPPLSGVPSPALAPRVFLHRDGRRRDTLFAEGRDDTPPPPAARGPRSPDVLPSGGADLLAHLEAVEAVNREQAAALHRLGAPSAS